VAGSERVAAGFNAVRREVLMRARDADKLKAEIVEMRRKMRGALDKSRDGQWDVKQGAGGMIDAEFITQYLVLRDAHRDARIVEWSDNWRQLDALEAIGSVTAAQEKVLIDSYRHYRAWTHERALQNENALADDALFTEERAAVIALWGSLLG
jgi:[glutamine synthetase] adenylyltransferase / [glutamine synthetase]-adenylyl-L-tyrosine phosphorylase